VYFSRQEIDSLSQVKKGWKKSHVSSESTTLVIEKENQSDVVSIVTSKQFTKPKTFMDFERDLRRQNSESDKAR
jgi:hypothetical protein